MIATHRITTYFKLAKGETGLTRIASQRLGMLDALDWIIQHAPEGSIHLDGPTSEQLIMITIDLNKADRS